MEEYTMDQLVNFDDDPLLFARWLGDEGFLKLKDQECKYCHGELRLQCISSPITHHIISAQTLQTTLHVPTKYVCDAQIPNVTDAFPSDPGHSSSTPTTPS
jgi:hypothetical protein